MSKKLQQYLVKSDTLFSLMLDESMTKSNKTGLIIYIQMLDPEGKEKCFRDRLSH